jgi:hypothetical protein
MRKGEAVAVVGGAAAGGVRCKRAGGRVVLRLGLPGRDENWTMNSLKNIRKLEQKMLRFRKK